MGNQLCALGIGLATICQLFQDTIPICLLAEKQDEVNLAIVVDGQALHPIHFLFPIVKVRDQTKDAFAAKLTDDFANA